jgi:hypothetical protein
MNPAGRPRDLFQELHASVHPSGGLPYGPLGASVCTGYSRKPEYTRVLVRMGREIREVGRGRAGAGMGGRWDGRALGWVCAGSVMGACTTDRSA